MSPARKGLSKACRLRRGRTSGIRRSALVVQDRGRELILHDEQVRHEALEAHVPARGLLAEGHDNAGIGVPVFFPPMCIARTPSEAGAGASLAPPVGPRAVARRVGAGLMAALRIASSTRLRPATRASSGARSVN